ncbi:gamma-mobile-trio recombinase GmtY [Vibrio tapetis]|uniref:Tyr recombinase domain-containing protein n=1 Tax=Vibrio tapetis subsp. tapetis TaxID=1671868 RepID=A0A2N8ZHI9_9VIBR|nr:gamma-mobile-trio recombinase GmtY [Vibrio tapetis]SON51365.1 conserved protein of unknown function [Vibrio tapetis subsp. tapetis]
MGKYTIVCRDRYVAQSGFQVIKLRVISINGFILESFLLYQLARKNKGKSWHRENAQALCLLLDYWQATRGVFQSPRLMFEAFSNALFSGTVQETGEDHTDLRWQPRTAKQTNKLVRYISTYSEFLLEKTGGENALLNPMVKATPYEEMLNLAAYHHRKNNSFLKHTHDDSQAYKDAKRTPFISKHREPQTFQMTYTFPKERTWDVVEKGFVIRGAKANEPLYKRLDLAKVLAFLLMRFCGLRISEVPNLYISDISLDPSQTKIHLDKKIPLIKVHHPEKGIAPNEWRKAYNKPYARRDEFLKTEYSMLPRSNKNSPKRLYTGWKNPVLIPRKFYMIAYFNNSHAAELFLIYWQLYLKFQAPKNQSHPFAFSNLRDGQPLSYKALLDGQKRAVERVGLISSKSEGTTPHGLRHLYKQELNELGLEPMYIRSMMHHKNINSQNDYGELSHDSIKERMLKAENKMQAQNE